LTIKSAAGATDATDVIANASAAPAQAVAQLLKDMTLPLFQPLLLDPPLPLPGAKTSLRLFDARRA
jgi:hypothetical protein